MKVSFLLAALILTGLAACESSIEVDNPRIVLETEDQTYHVGDTIVLSLTNLTGKRVKIPVRFYSSFNDYNFVCNTRRLQDGKLNSHQTGSIIMEFDYYPIDHGRSLTETSVLGPGFKPGFDYRKECIAESSGGPVYFNSNTFSIAEE